MSTFSRDPRELDALASAQVQAGLPSAECPEEVAGVPTDVRQLRGELEQTLLPQVEILSLDPHDPVIVRSLPQPWSVIGTGNYAAVFTHPAFPHHVVKLYAPGRAGWAEEVEVYRQIGQHPAFSQCFEAAEPFLILRRLRGVTLYDCIHQGIPIPPKAIADVDAALAYARDRGLRPHDIHGRNILLWQGRGLIVDISDFLKPGDCSIWTDLKRAYHWLYRPLFSKLRWRVPHWLLNGIRRGYRTSKRWRKRLNHIFHLAQRTGSPP